MRNRKVIKGFSYSVLAAACWALVNGAYAANIVPPPGFEDLSSGYSDFTAITFLGKQLPAQQVRVTDKAVQFIDPRALLPRLNIKPALEAEVLAALSQPLARHDDLLCTASAPVAKCDYLEPATVGIIFDDANGRTELFVNEKYLRAPPQKVAPSRYYQENQDVISGFVHSQLINVVQSPGVSSLSMNGIGALGVDAHSYFGLRWMFDENSQNGNTYSDRDLQDLYYRYDFGSHNYAQAGRMDAQDLYSAAGGSFSFNSLPLPVFNGARLGTGLAYVNQSVDFSANPLTVFLQHNSRVDAYRGSQLLGSFNLSAGSQNLDTSRFPDGSYPVTLKIYEGTQLVSTQTQLYTRTSGAGRPGNIDWFVQGGQLLGKDAATGYQQGSSHTLQSGLRLPLWGGMAMTLGVSGDQYAKYGEVQLSGSRAVAHTDATVSSTLSYFRGDNQVHADWEQLTWSDGINLSVYHNRLSTPQCSNVASPLASFNGCSNNWNLSASRAFGNWVLSTSYNYNSSNAAPQVLQPVQQNYDPTLATSTYAYSQQSGSSYSVGATRSFTLGKTMLSLQLSVFRNGANQSAVGGGTGVFVNLTFSPRPQTYSSQHTGSTSLGLTTQRTAGDVSRDYSFDHAETWSGGSQRELDLHLDDQDAAQQNALVTGRYSGQWGRLSVSGGTSHMRGSSSDSTLSGSYDSAFAITPAGVAYGLDTGNLTEPGGGILVKVGSVGDESALQVESASIPSMSVSSGHTALIPVDGYSVGSVHVHELEKADAGVLSITGGTDAGGFLIPGHFYLDKVNASAQYTFMGRALLGSKPITGAMLVAQPGGIAMGPVTNEYGDFLVQLPSKKTSVKLFAVTGQQVYACSIKHVESGSGVIYVGDLSCQLSSRDVLGADILKKADSVFQSAQNDQPKE